MALDSGSLSVFRHVVEAVPMAWAVEMSSDPHEVHNNTSDMMYRKCR